ncbi:MAG TPA: class I SAM-dependent methyltransferase [Chitinophagaceae bacterium]|nr:class I SAM-dependent methyltransferase [Chitinophagaceae bacterium]HMZ45289.1 class I SAM-dependent methyltransferase [Chitinophagaceae bacterium]HNF30137.1 class I SAM-dependent methyltransferase [Chitinophagaceae bacterium]HNJ57976.1 class I SAM-dependent methyltransferase [Chitinophagaceae bacterium]HNL82231.1 class I SAM-dependent methyltransferase [Chitinophagaceae bacterium]
MQTKVTKQFNPPLTSAYYFIRKLLLHKIIEYKNHLQGNLLDFGCGSKPYKSLFNHVSSYTGVDYENTGHSHINEQIDVFYDGKNIPFKDNEFDSILCSEVFEHVFNLEEILPDLNRVLKPGGKILITCPFVWNEHEVPYDYARYTQFALKHLLEKNGFKIIVLDKSGDFATTLHQMKMVYISEHFLQSIFIIGKLKFITSNIRSPLMFLCNGLFLLLHKLMPKRNDLYLNNIVIAEKK